jgi:UDP-N-acetylmuramate--alanine ligase
VYNSLAAIGVGMELNIDFKIIKKALMEFKGIQRRFQLRAKKNEISWIDDYAHHPTEIKMTLKAAKGLSSKRVVALFQPHRYSRTRDLLDDFMTAFYDADVLIITDIYSANESPIPGITTQHLYEGLKQYGHKDVSYIPELNDVGKYVLNLLKEGDIFLTLGAGDVWKAGETIMNELL